MRKSQRRSHATLPAVVLGVIATLLGGFAVGCGLLVPVFQERGTGLFRVVGTGPGQASSMRCPTRTKCCALTRRGLPGR